MKLDVSLLEVWCHTLAYCIIYLLFLPGRRCLMWVVDTSSPQQSKLRKTQGRFRVSSEHSCVYVKCIQSHRGSEGNILRQIVPEDEELHLPHGFPPSLPSSREWRCAIHALSFPPHFLRLNRSVHLIPRRSHLGPDCENVSTVWSKGGRSFVKWDGLFGICFVTVWAWMFDGSLCAVCQVY